MAEIKEIKYTQKQFYEAIIAIANGEQTAIPMDKVAEFAEKKIGQLDNKTGKVSAKRTEEVDAFIDLIRDVLAESADARGMQCGAIAKDERIASFKWADGKETSSQRVSAMLKKMVESGDVAKVTDKKVTYFHLA
jgi:hypothetical protein